MRLTLRRPPRRRRPSPALPGRESRRSQIDRGSDRPAKANADRSIGRRTDLQKSTRPSSRSWKLIAGGLALAGAAAVCVSFALMNKAPDLPEREPSVAATESLVRPQNETDSRALKLPPAGSPGTRRRSRRAQPPCWWPRIGSGRTGRRLRQRPSSACFAQFVLAEAPKTAAPSAASPAIGPDGSPDCVRAVHSRFDGFGGPSGTDAKACGPGGSFASN